jgi:hypothetical protein
MRSNLQLAEPKVKRTVPTRFVHLDEFLHHPTPRFINEEDHHDEVGAFDDDG